MLIVHGTAHGLHDPPSAMARAGQPPHFDAAARVGLALDALRTQGRHAFRLAGDAGLAPIARVHQADYLDFLRSAWDRWPRERSAEVALPQFWPVHGRRSGGVGARLPGSVVAQLGWFAGDAIAPLMAGTWEAAYESAQVALTAQQAISDGARSALALCRPPGHHAGAARLAGYCYLNNAAVAAQAFIDSGVQRVALLDIDYHHGNGTQEIFYERADVQVCSVHADPLDDYPYFVGYADETGAGAGEGFNLNCPLPAGSGWPVWRQAMEVCCQRVASYDPQALVVSLGVDTHRDDPSGSFTLDSGHYVEVGRRLAALGLPTLFVLEGGYALEVLGANVANVVAGFEEAAR
jgi:acetoin utilization deacetylase AcuC-like enzyme